MINQLDMIVYRRLFESRLDSLRSVDVLQLENYFLGLPDTIPKTTINDTVAVGLLEELVNVAQRIGFSNIEDLRLSDNPIKPLLSDDEKVRAVFDWLQTNLGRDKDKKSLAAIVNANGTILPSYLFVNSPSDWQEMAEAYCQFVDVLHNDGDNFVIYVARDASHLFEIDTYLGRLKGEEKRAGLIYRSGLKINYQDFDATNHTLIEIMQTASVEFLEEDKDSLRNIDHKFGGGMRPEGEINLKLKKIYAGVPDHEVYRMFESRVIEAVAEELGRDEYSTFYKQSRDYFEQMKRTGVFDSKKRRVTFVDTGGTGKTLLYSKAVFDYFSCLEGREKESDVLIVNRYKNYTNKGQAEIPGFPSVLDETGSSRDETSQYKLHNIINPRILRTESDIQPFYAVKVVDGDVTLQPNPISIQMLCLARSIINWNQAIEYSSSR